jgi:6-pyruvoyl-tetrahydropterin synthase related domain
VALTPARRDAVGGFVAIGCVLAVTLWALHPSLLVADTLTAGGDTGAHVALPWFLRTELLPHGQLTGWYPGWFDGFPLYTYYFVLSDLLAALGSFVVPYTVAFKLTTVLGSLLLPVCAYAMGRLFRLRAPVPACLAASTLPFLFESSFTISGGNLFSTLAGEYAFSLSLALSLVALGLVARGLRTGRGVVAGAVALSVTLAAHVLPWLWALAGIAILVVVDLAPPRLRLTDPVPGDRTAPRAVVASYLARAGLLSAALSAWWLVPWVTGQSYAISMGYLNDGAPGQASFAHQLFPSGDRVMLVAALLGLGVAWAKRSRFGVWLTTLTALSGAAYVLDPQGSLWNERLLPFWFFGGWLTCGWLFGVTASWVAQRWRQHAAERWVADVHAGVRRRRAPRPLPTGWPAAVGGAVAAGLVAVVVVVPPMTSLVPRSVLSAIGITPGANEVPVWAAYNFTGYQGVPGWSSYDKDWAEYHAVIQMMAQAGAVHGCGQAMWEYDPSETNFGTTESLMLLPYWTDNCIGSMEGLLFESSATTPYHFLNQSELSLRPSDPMVGLPYGLSGSPNVVLGLRHLQLLGVRYFLAYSPAIVAAAIRSHLVTPLATSGPWTWTKTAPTTRRTWHLFLVRAAPVVSGLDALPNVVQGLSSSDAWLHANVAWWLHPSRWGVYLAAAGPSTWPRLDSPCPPHPAGAPGTTTTTVAGEAKGPAPSSCAGVRVPVPAVSVSAVHVGVSRVSFHVSRIGVPVVVRVSYYPRWHASGASGPWRVSPNLMVVVPTARDVTLTYGADLANEVGVAVTLAALAVVAASLLVGWRRRVGARFPATTE